jgi:hypothetical protein
MTDLRERIIALNNLVVQGSIMEAFEKYYDNDVIMQENEQQPTVGKEANRKRELEFPANIEELRAADVMDVTAGDSTTMVIWHYDYTHKEWGVKNYTQVSVQNWKNGKIVKEQFFYGN